MSIDRDLEDLARRALGPCTIVGRHPTQRAASQILRVRDAAGAEFVVKRHLNPRKHQREVHAYTHWTAALAGHTPRLVVADSTVPGVVLTALAGSPAEPSPDTHRKAGQLLRQLHDAPPGPTVPGRSLTERFSRWRAEAERLLAPEELALVQRHTANLTEVGALPEVPCHLDYQPHNWLLGPAGSLHVIDFEHARLDPAVRDFVRLEFRYWTDRLDPREAFLDGYGRTLSDAERAALLSCAAIDAVTAIARGHTANDPVLTATGYATLHRLRKLDRPPYRTAPARNLRLSASAAPGIGKQLEQPDLIGRDLALFRTRAYRFSDDRRHYVLAELLEEKLLAGWPPTSLTLAYIRTCLAQLREVGHMPTFDEETVTAEGIDLRAELDQRTPYAYQNVPPVEPAGVLAVVGAPRSGTSHLINLLARTSRFAYLTTASCWAWPVRNLHQPGRRLFTDTDEPVLAVDNKLTRTIPGLVMPGEAEDIYARAIPVYRHLAGHRYEIHEARPGELDILTAAASAHLRHFDRQWLLTKSPFNSFRIPQLEALWGTRLRYVHILRDQHETADSLRRNRFEYIHEDGTVQRAVFPARHAGLRFGGMGTVSDDIGCCESTEE